MKTKLLNGLRIRLRNWLILKLSGNSTVILNVQIRHARIIKKDGQVISSNPDENPLLFVREDNLVARFSMYHIIIDNGEPYRPLVFDDDFLHTHNGISQTAGTYKVYG